MRFMMIYKPTETTDMEAGVSPTQEQIAGFAIVQAKSKAEAVKLARFVRCTMRPLSRGKPLPVRRCKEFVQPAPLLSRFGIRTLRNQPLTEPRP